MSQPPELPRDEPPPFAQPVELDYLSRHSVGAIRPGIVTALGITSIIFAILQALSGAGSILSTVVMLFVGSGALAGPTTTTATYQARGTVTISSTTQTTSSVEPTLVAEPKVGPRGVRQQQRSLIIAAVRERLPLSPARADVLDAMLAQVGKDLAIGAASVTTAEQASAIITSTARTGAGEDVIDFPDGRLTLQDLEATFEPPGRSSVVYRSFRESSPLPGEPGFDTSAPAIFQRRGQTAQQTTQQAAAQAQAQAQFNTIMGAMSPQQSPVLNGLAVLASVGSIILSVMLLIAGIKVLRGRRSGRKLHLIWAPTKIVVETFGAVVGGLLLIELINAMNAASTGGMGTSATLAAVFSGGFGWLFSMAYPIAVLIVMTRQSAKEYFATLS